MSLPSSAVDGGQRYRDTLSITYACFLLSFQDFATEDVDICDTGQADRGNSQMNRHPQSSNVHTETSPIMKRFVEASGPLLSTYLNIPSSSKSRAKSDSMKPGSLSPTSSAKQYFKCLSSSSWHHRR